MVPWQGSFRDGWQEKGRVKTSQNIYVLDIEVTTLLHYKDGWKCFDPKRPAIETRAAKKAAVPYIWQFGIEDKDDCRTYYGREFYELRDLFGQMADENRKKIVWVFNLAYEFQFLRDILPEVSEMCARRARHPIKFYVKEWNIEFRCAYCLTNLSLKKAAETYGQRRKLSGEDFDYNQERSPLTYLPPEKLDYCEYDILSVYDIIKYYRKKYKKLQWIPLTATGEVRKEFRKRVDPGYVYRIQKLVPKDPELFILLMRAFMGGITHANYLKVNKLLFDYISGDEASSYPAVMCSDLYPLTPFRRVSPEKLPGLNLDKWAALIHVTFKDVKSIYINHYILKSSCVRLQNGTYDNGRVIAADEVEMVLTDVDYQIIKKSYHIGSEHVKSLHISRKGYLPKEYIEYVLELYGRKTSLKGVEGQEELYRKSKNTINSLFGVCCTNVIKGSCEYTAAGEWVTHALSMEFVKEKLDDLRHSRSNCFAYQFGVWLTAHARRRLWEVACFALDPVVVGYEKSSAYYDTDSTKAPDSPEFRAAMEKSNMEIDTKLRKMCETYEIDFELTRPKDPAGVPHPLGHWEFDGHYDEFKTLGAKRYAYKDDKGLHITIAGVNPKKGVAALSCVDDLKKSMVFNYEQCGKSTSYYLDNGDMPEVVDFVDIDGNSYQSRQRYGIAIVSTTYNMTIDPYFEALCELEMEKGDKVI